MVEILSAVLTGAAFGREVGSVFTTWDRPVDVGHCFIAIGIERFMDGPAFVERVERLLGWITSVPPVQGAGAVRYPGELHASAAARAEREGIPVPTDSLAALEELAREVGVSTPWSG
jgi:LDH2 family malate/lactate/ureidoglycolate dehydrogenase